MKTKFKILGLLVYLFVFGACCQDDFYIYSDSSEVEVYFYCDSLIDTSEEIKIYGSSGNSDTIYLGFYEGETSEIDSLYVRYARLPLNAKDTSSVFNVAFRGEVRKIAFSYSVSGEIVKNCGYSYVTYFNDLNLYETNVDTTVSQEIKNYVENYYYSEPNYVFDLSSF